MEWSDDSQSDSGGAKLSSKVRVDKAQKDC